MEHKGKLGKGSPKNPMTREERHAKFRRLAGAALASARIEAIIAVVESLEQAAGVERLVQLLQPSA